MLYLQRKDLDVLNFFIILKNLNNGHSNVLSVESGEEFASEFDIRLISDGVAIFIFIEERVGRSESS
jgi:hypothetical protein